MVELEDMRQRINNSPFAAQLGMELVELKPGFAKAELKLKEEFLNWEGSVHGGLIFTLLDHVGGSAVNSFNDRYVASQINVNYLEAANVGETLYAESKVLKAGRRMGICEMTAFNSNGQTIANATSVVTNIGPKI